MKFIFLLTIITLFATSNTYCKEKELIEVKIGAIAALNPLNNTFSERFKFGYLSALDYAKSDTEEQLAKCGYKYVFNFESYQTNDQIDVIKAANKLSYDSWAVIGPDHSNEFILVQKILNNTPIVSVLASSKEVSELPPPVFTMSLPIDQMAYLTTKIVEKSKYGMNYGAVVDLNCKVCQQFSDYFHSHSKSKYKKLFDIKVTGNTPDLTELVDKLKTIEVDFLLLPNFSKQSGYIISYLNNDYSHIKFVGSDGWGDDEFGYLTKFSIGKNQQGITLRNGDLYTEKIEKFKLKNFVLNWKDESLKISDTYFGIIHFLRMQANLLCEKKPKSRSIFIEHMKSLPKNSFILSSNANVYFLENTQLLFGYSYNEKKKN
ncbi:hypothetical protein [Fluviispira vulneris]|uniref:hypothetical protein n=1 Tax=Fluviispira vulneris TaxID=2763012 RepID=UPI0016481FB9|nr:hypothetical protein [Fluviispira vulneris]